MVKKSQFHDILSRQRGIGTVFGFKYHRAAFQTLQRMPLPFRDTEATKVAAWSHNESVGHKISNQN